MIPSVRGVGRALGVCALLAGMLAPAPALAQGGGPPMAPPKSDPDDQPLPGIEGSGDGGDDEKSPAIGRELERYELDGSTDLSLLKPESWFEAIPHLLAQIVWEVAIWIVWLALLVLTWAFDIDLVNGPNGALGPVGQAVDGIYAELGGGFLVAAVLLAGLWALYRGIAQRRYAQTVGGLALSVLCVAGALWTITDPQATVGEVASWSQGASADLLALSQEVAPATATDGPAAPLPGSPSGGTRKAADTIFSVAIYEPWQVLNGGDDKDAEIRKGEAGLRRLGLTLLVAVGAVGIAALVGFVALAIVLLQAVALLIFAFAPVALLAAVVPERGHDVFWTWLRRLGGALITKALLSLLLGIVLALGAAVLAAGQQSGWFAAFFLYSAFFWVVLVYYQRIFGGLPLRAATAPARGVWQATKRVGRNAERELSRSAHERRQERTYERRSEERKREGMVEQTRRGRDRLEDELTPAHVRDERALARQRELREEAKQLEDKASSTPGDRERLEEIRAGLVSDGAYAGLKERVAERGGSPESGASEGRVGADRHREEKAGAGRGSESPMLREMREHREHVLYLPPGIRSTSTPLPAASRRVETVEDPRARAYSVRSDRPPRPGRSLHDESRAPTPDRRVAERPSDEIRPPWSPPPRPEEER